MAIQILSPRQVLVAADGDYSDGDGLFLRVRGKNAAWVHRYTAPDGRRREMGLGAVDRSGQAAVGESIKRARRAVAENRKLLDLRIDPLAQQKADIEMARAETVAVTTGNRLRQQTLAQVARDYHEKIVEPRRTTKHAAQWIASLERNMPDKIWHAPIESVDAVDLYETLAELQVRIPETTSRIRQRLEVIFDHAEFYKFCTGNPARLVRRKLAEAPQGRPAGQFAALSYAEVPAFVQKVRAQRGNAARALEFGILTAARTGEILGATWDEVDFERAVWVVPAGRMKAGREHVVSLSTPAISVLRHMQHLESAYLFPSPVNVARPMSNMAMLNVLKRMGVSKSTTVHGVCRATFSTWANEHSIARAEVIEACLAHREQDQVRAAYNRAKFNSERRTLLDKWANFCGSIAAIKIESVSVAIAA